MNKMYTAACVALINDDIHKLSKKFNQPLIEDYDDLDYFEALFLNLTNGIPYVLQRYRGYEKNTFAMFIPPALENYEEVIKSILEILEVDNSQVTLYLEEYERIYVVVPWNKRLKAWNERLKEIKRKKNEEK